MMRLYLFRAYHPALVVYSDGVNTEKIKEGYSEHPAVFVEITRWQHGKRHIDISQYKSHITQLPFASVSRIMGREYLE